MKLQELLSWNETIVGFTPAVICSAICIIACFVCKILIKNANLTLKIEKDAILKELKDEKEKNDRIVKSHKKALVHILNGFVSDCNDLVPFIKYYIDNLTKEEKKEIYDSYYNKNKRSHLSIDDNGDIEYDKFINRYDE